MKRYAPNFDLLGRECRRCGHYKLWDAYSRQPNGIFGRQGTCKECEKERRKQRVAEDPEWVEKRRAAARKADKNPARIAARKERDKLKRAKPGFIERERERVKAPHRKETRNKSRRERRKRDPDYRFFENVRGMLHRSLYAAGAKKSLPTFEALGYGPDKLKARISCQFLSGMSWQNYGEWHIDHIKPVSAFAAEGVKDPKIINALCNLRPMWATDNIRKNAKWNGPKEASIKAANDNAPTGPKNARTIHHSGHKST